MAQDGSINIDARINTSGIRNDVRNLQSQLDRAANNMPNLGGPMATEFTHSTRQMRYEYQRMSRYMTQETINMRNEMRQYYREQRDAQYQYINRQTEIQYGFYEMSRNARDFQGTNQQFLNQLRDQGNLQRQLNDEMMANNQMIVAGIQRSAGALLARSTAASKIAAQYERMGNPIYNVNQGLLTMAGNLQRIAQNGQPAVIALRMLGPTANGKQLNDLIRQIGTQLMALPIIALGAGIATVAMFGMMHKAALEFSEVYKEAFEGMTEALQRLGKPFIEVWVAITVPIYTFITAIANMINAFNEANPTIARMIALFLILIPPLTLILSPLAIGIGLLGGYSAAWGALWMIIGPVVTGLAAMMGTVILVSAAITALAFGFIHLYQNSETFRNGIETSLGAVKSFGQAIINLGKYFLEVITSGKALNDQLGTLPKFMQEFVLAVGYGVKQVALWFKELGANILQAFSGNFQPLVEQVGQLFPLIVGVLVGGLPALLMFVARILPMVAERLGTTSEALVVKVSEIINNVVNAMVQFLTTQLPIMVEEGVKLLEGLVNGLLQALPILTNAFVTLMTAIVETITTLLPTIIEAGVAILQAVIDGLITLLPVLVEAAMNIVTTLVEGLLQMLPSIMEAGLQLITTLLETILGLLPQILEMGVEVLMSLVKGIVEALPELIETAVELVSQLIDTIVDLLPKIVETGTEVLISLIEGIIEVLPELLAAALKLVVDLVATIILNLPKIIEAGKRILKAIVMGIIQIIGELIAAIVKLVTMILTTLDGRLKDMILAGGRILMAFITGIIEKIGNLVSAFANDVWNGIKDGTSNFVREATSIGRDIIGGIIEGVIDKAKDLASTVANAARSALDAAKGALGIHSPSREFRDEVGKWIPPGIAAGVEENEGILDASIRTMVDGAIDAPNLTKGGIIGGRGTSSTTNNTYQQGVTQHINFAQRELSPYEQIRQIRKAGEQAALAW